MDHPNIAGIHGLERGNGTTALVMELVEGSTLADRIAQAPFPLDETLRIAKQIAEALEAITADGRHIVLNLLNLTNPGSSRLHVRSLDQLQLQEVPVTGSSLARQSVPVT